MPTNADKLERIAQEIAWTLGTTADEITIVTLAKVGTSYYGRLYDVKWYFSDASYAPRESLFITHRDIWEQLI